MQKPKKSFLETQPNLFDKCIAFRIEISRPGIRRKVQSDSMQLKEGHGEQPKTENIGVSKKLFSCPEFDEIMSSDNAIRSDILKLSLPSPFGRGVYLIPLANLEVVDSMIQEYRSRRLMEISKFIDVYEQAVRDAKNDLGGVFNPADYLSKESIAAEFGVETNYIEETLPGRLKSISPEIFKRERAEFSDKLKNAAIEIQQALRVKFAELISHLAEVLGDSPDGNKRRFKKNSFENFEEFINNFKNLNITDDNDLTELVEKAKLVMKGCDVEVLRKNDDFREEIKKEFEKIEKILPSMIEVKPLRKFNFASED